MRYRSPVPAANDPQKLLVALLGLTLLAAAGCGKDNPLGRRAISGSITLDGQPLSHGNIEFAPRNPAGVGSGVMITDGQYAITEQHGLPPGDYDVRIFSPNTDSPAPEGPPGPLGPPAVEERIPARYNAETELSVTVAADGPTVFDFSLEGS